MGQIFIFIIIIYVLVALTLQMIDLFIKCLYKHRHKIANKRIWLKEIEPLHRNFKGYPEDWDTRKKFIYNKFRGKCFNCGRKLNKYSFHVHHEIPISKGGNHSFPNLQLLCENCHCAIHPKLNRMIYKNKLLRGLSGDAKVKTARKLWKCAFCGNTINLGDKYYGDNYTKLCVKCSNKKINNE